jgi:hypothetical protein
LDGRDGRHSRADRGGLVVVAMKNGEIHRNGTYTLAICCGAMNCHIKAPSMSSFKFSFWGDRQTVATWE